MFIYSNLAISLDGKIALPERHFDSDIGSDTHQKNTLTLRKGANAILMGGGALRAYKRPLLYPQKRVVNVVLSRSLRGIKADFPFFQTEQTERVLFLTGKLSRKRETEFSRTSLITYLKNKDPIREMLSHLRKMKVKFLLIEGGSQMMWEFVSRNLIDEYNVTLTPYIIGGTKAPTMVDGEGFTRDTMKKLTLTSSQRIRDEMFLVYRKK